ncbi:MAG: hypothetical protein ACRD4S_16495 [Candidatus Acidiferrales bacterium]
MATAGCVKDKVHAAPPVATIPSSAPIETKPATPAPVRPPKIDAEPTPAVMPTDKNNTTPPQPPPKVHKSSDDTGESESSSASDKPAHPAAPQISPQLSPGDQAIYSRKTTEDVSAAESNLKQSQGKQLSAAQQDLADKIRSFLAQSLEASQGGDWARAQNLAQKARLLSVELVNSL